MSYMDLLTTSPDAIEWSSFNECGLILDKCDDFYRIDIVRSLLKSENSFAEPFLTFHLILRSQIFHELAEIL